MPNERHSYIQMIQDLKDPEVYFLHQLRKELDGDDHYSRLYTEMNNKELDHSSFHHISAIMGNPNEKMRLNSKPARQTLGDYMKQYNGSGIWGDQEESFMLERKAFNGPGEDIFADRSIAVDPADFKEPKLLTTERKVLHLTEIDRENLKM